MLGRPLVSYLPDRSARNSGRGRASARRCRGRVGHDSSAVPSTSTFSGTVFEIIAAPRADRTARDLRSAEGKSCDVRTGPRRSESVTSHGRARTTVQRPGALLEWLRRRPLPLGLVNLAHLASARSPGQIAVTPPGCLLRDLRREKSRDGNPRQNEGEQYEVNQ